jgi:hypothetical protein
MIHVSFYLLVLDDTVVHAVVVAVIAKEKASLKVK